MVLLPTEAICTVLLLGFAPPMAAAKGDVGLHMSCRRQRVRGGECRGSVLTCVEHTHTRARTHTEIRNAHIQLSTCVDLPWRERSVCVCPRGKEARWWWWWFFFWGGGGM